MAAITAEIRGGAYYDSVVLMQLQRSLAALPKIVDAGVVMGTDANKEILSQSQLLSTEAQSAAADDLIVVVKADDLAAAEAAIAQVDELLTRRRVVIEQEYQPKSLHSAAQMLPEAQWVLVSVPGQHATAVAREALRLGKHVFLYSDNVPLADEIALKHEAAAKGLMVMGPDCGTAIVNGVGLGFANVVRRGNIGLVAASGTGLQQVSTQIHQLGAGLTHGLGTGGRDLSEGVGAITAKQGLDLLSRDADTQVIVLISKPPAPAVAQDLLRLARRAAKPVVVDFIGYQAERAQVDNLHFVTTLDAAARTAIQLARTDSENGQPAPRPTFPFISSQRYLRGLYSGGTLAYEALLILRDYLPDVYSNISLSGIQPLENPLISTKNTIIDLGEDVFTVGRLHPMMDNDLRIRRLKQEAADPDVAIILLDVVLGYGSHPHPASELTPAMLDARAIAQADGRDIEIVVVVVGTDQDPQNFDKQVEQLKAAKIQLFTSNEAAVHYVGELLQQLEADADPAAVSLESIEKPLAAINVGLDSFAESLIAQEAQVIHVDWRPPAGGNEKLAGILARMKG